MSAGPTLADRLKDIRRPPRNALEMTHTMTTVLTRERERFSQALVCHIHGPKSEWRTIPWVYAFGTGIAYKLDPNGPASFPPVTATTRLPHFADDADLSNGFGVFVKLEDDVKPREVEAYTLNAVAWIRYLAAVAAVSAPKTRLRGVCIVTSPACRFTKAHEHIKIAVNTLFAAVDALAEPKPLVIFDTGDVPTECIRRRSTVGIVLRVPLDAYSLPDRVNCVFGKTCLAELHLDEPYDQLTRAHVEKIQGVRCRRLVVRYTRTSDAPPPRGARHDALLRLLVAVALKKPEIESASVAVHTRLYPPTPLTTITGRAEYPLPPAPSHHGLDVAPLLTSTTLRHLSLAGLAHGEVLEFLASPHARFGQSRLETLTIGTPTDTIWHNSSKPTLAHGVATFLACNRSVIGLNVDLMAAAHDFGEIAVALRKNTALVRLLTVYACDTPYTDWNPAAPKVSDEDRVRLAREALDRVRGAMNHRRWLYVCARGTAVLAWAFRAMGASCLRMSVLPLLRTIDRFDEYLADEPLAVFQHPIRVTRPPPTSSSSSSSSSLSSSVAAAAAESTTPTTVTATSTHPVHTTAYAFVSRFASSRYVNSFAASDAVVVNAYAPSTPWTSSRKRPHCLL